jgi:hypothetical protein
MAKEKCFDRFESKQSRVSIVPVQNIKEAIKLLAIMVEKENIEKKEIELIEIVGCYD